MARDRDGSALLATLAAVETVVAAHEVALGLVDDERSLPVRLERLLAALQATEDASAPWVALACELSATLHAIQHRQWEAWTECPERGCRTVRGMVDLRSPGAREATV